MKKEEFSGKREQDSEESFSFIEKDLRYKHYKVSEKRTSSAVIFLLNGRVRLNGDYQEISV